MCATFKPISDPNLSNIFDSPYSPGFVSNIKYYNSMNKTKASLRFNSFISPLSVRNLLIQLVSTSLWECECLELRAGQLGECLLGTLPVALLPSNQYLAATQHAIMAWYWTHWAQIYPSPTFSLPASLFPLPLFLPLFLCFVSCTSPLSVSLQHLWQILFSFLGVRIA